MAKPRPELTGQAEDYLKAIYELEQGGEPAATNALAGRLGIAAASVSGMLQRLGIETREFSTGKGTMRGLETA